MLLECGIHFRNFWEFHTQLSVIYKEWSEKSEERRSSVDKKKYCVDAREEWINHKLKSSLSVRWTPQAATMSITQSKRAPSRCGGMGDQHHGCAVEQSASTAWSYPVNTAKNLWDVLSKVYRRTESSLIHIGKWKRVHLETTAAANDYSRKCLQSSATLNRLRSSFL